MSQPSPPNPFADDPIESPTTGTASQPIAVTPEREAYNIVSDMVVGMNVRRSDNLFQLKVVLICMLILAPIGAIAGGVLADADYRLPAVLFGGVGLGFVGVVLGAFGSGIYLMIYRAARHLKGQHD